MRRRGQSFLEYTLLVAVAVLGFCAVAASLFDRQGTLMNSFRSHFESVQSRITG